MLTDLYDGWDAAVPGAGHDVSAGLWFSEVEAHYREKIDDARRRNGAEHPDTLAAIVHLGVRLRHRGRLSEAEPLLQEGMQTAQRVLGPEHKITLRAMNSLGMLRREQGRLLEAEELSSVVLGRAKRTWNGEMVTRHYMVRHAQNLVALRRFDQAEAQMIEVTEIRAPAWEETTLAACEVIAAIADHHDACHAAEPDADHAARATSWRSRGVGMAQPRNPAARCRRAGSP